MLWIRGDGTMVSMDASRCVDVGSKPPFAVILPRIKAAALPGLCSYSEIEAHNSVHLVNKSPCTKLSISGTRISS